MSVLQKNDGLGLCCKNGKKEGGKREKEDHNKDFSCFCVCAFAFNKRH